jgi:hypothetical protein
MKGWLGALGLCLTLAGFVAANDVELVGLAFRHEYVHLISPQKRADAHRQRCSGMYSRKSWGGQVEPFILVKFRNTTIEGDGDPLVSLVIFEWNDEALIGRHLEGHNQV